MWWYCYSLGHVFVTACIILALHRVGITLFRLPHLIFFFSNLDNHSTVVCWSESTSHRGSGVVDSWSLVLSRYGVRMAGLPPPAPRSVPTRFTSNLTLVLCSVTQTPTSRRACNWQTHRNTQPQTPKGRNKEKNIRELFIPLFMTPWLTGAGRRCHLRRLRDAMRPVGRRVWQERASWGSCH